MTIQRLPLRWSLPLLLFLSQAGAQEGFELTADGVAINRAAQWEHWTRPKHAVRIDPQTHALTPRRIGQATDAILDVDRFQTLIGNQSAYDKLVKELNRADRPIPLNIRTAPAAVAGVPIVYLKANKKKNIEVGDPIIWYYYHGGIRQAGTSVETAAAMLDGDPTTYWEPSTLVSRTEYDDLASAGPIYFFVKGDNGLERRVDEATYKAAAPSDRRVEYHNHSLENWTVDIDLGRLVAHRQGGAALPRSQRGRAFPPSASARHAFGRAGCGFVAHRPHHCPGRKPNLGGVQPRPGRRRPIPAAPHSPHRGHRQQARQVRSRCGS